MGAVTDVGADRPTPDAPGAVVVLSTLQLMTQTVTAALRSRGVDAQCRSWVPGVRHAVHELTRRDVVVLLDDLEDRDSVMATSDLVRQSAAPVIVLTRCGEGPAWGAVLASGAVGLMPVQSPVDDVVAALARACRGEPVISMVRRSHLEHEWFEWLAQDTYRRWSAELLPPHEHVLVEPLAGVSSDDCWQSMSRVPRQRERRTAALG